MTVRRAFLRCPQWLVITTGVGLPWQGGQHPSLLPTLSYVEGNNNPTELPEIKGGPNKIAGL